MQRTIDIARDRMVTMQRAMQGVESPMARIMNGEAVATFLKGPVGGHKELNDLPMQIPQTREKCERWFGEDEMRGARKEWIQAVRWNVLVAVEDRISQEHGPKKACHREWRGTHLGF